MNWVKGLIFDFFYGLFFIFGVFDRFLMVLLFFCFSPVFFFVSDLLKLFSYYFYLFIFKRCLYILSYKKFGRDFFFNNLLFLWDSWVSRRDSLFLPFDSDKEIKRRISIGHLFLCFFFVIKLLIYIVFSLYIYFIVPDKKLRIQIKNKSYFLSAFVNMRLDFLAFRDENMHPGYKSEWSILLWWFSDLFS
jgi:hypothetical protein